MFSSVTIKEIESAPHFLTDIHPMVQSMEKPYNFVCVVTEHIIAYMICTGDSVTITATVTARKNVFLNVLG